MTVIDLKAFKAATQPPPAPQEQPEPAWETPRHRYASPISGMAKDDPEGRTKAEIYREKLRNVMRRNAAKDNPEVGIVLRLCEHRKLRREITKAENRDYALKCLFEEQNKPTSKPQIISALLNTTDPENGTPPPSGAQIIALSNSRT